MALARLVLPTPGTSSMSRWPSASRQMTASSIASVLPWTTGRCSLVMASNSEAKVRAGASGSPSRRGRVDGARAAREVGGPVSYRLATFDACDLPRRRRRWHQAGRRCRRRRRARSWCAIAPPPHRATSWPALAALVTACRSRRPRRAPVAVRRRLRRADRSVGGDRSRRCNIPGWRGLPARGRAGGADRGCRWSSTTTPRRWPSARRGAARRGGGRDFLGVVVGTGVGRRHRQRRPAAARRRVGNAGHIGHVVVEPDGRAVHRAAARAASRPRRRAGDRGRDRSAAAAMRRSPIVERTGRAGRPGGGRRSARCCDLQLAVIGGSVALGFGEPFFAAAQAELDRRARIAFASGVRIVPAGAGRRRAADRRGGRWPDGRWSAASTAPRGPVRRRLPVGSLSVRCDPRIRPRPRPTARRSRPSSPRSCRPSWAGIGQLEGDDAGSASSPSGARRSTSAGYLAPGWPASTAAAACRRSSR